MPVRDERDGPDAGQQQDHTADPAPPVTVVAACAPSLHGNRECAYHGQDADQMQQPPLEYDPVLCQKQTCKAVLNPLW